jgi:hypothetical protein
MAELDKTLSISTHNVTYLDLLDKAENVQEEAT